MKGWKFVFLIFLFLAAFLGTVWEGFYLTQSFYFWPLVRLVGYASLLAYALFLLRIRFRGYNKPLITQEEEPR